MKKPTIERKMNEIEAKEVAASWVRMHLAKFDSVEYGEEFWSFEKLSGFCREKPEYAWKIIVEIYENYFEEKIRANLAAGPMEDLLANHGGFALHQIDQYCADKSEFVEILRMVWRNSISEDIWIQLQNVIIRRS